ncbi:MAG: hypothetical protein C0619_12130 [Desulfuromonas sp.]|nr:MAG: hypothetical protein C0619_12130 [Desulfuromonas sp.]
MRRNVGYKLHISPLQLLLNRSLNQDMFLIPKSAAPRPVRQKFRLFVSHETKKLDKQKPHDTLYDKCLSGDRQYSLQWRTIVALTPPLKETKRARAYRFQDVEAVS